MELVRLADRCSPKRQRKGREGQRQERQRKVERKRRWRSERRRGEQRKGRRRIEEKASAEAVSGLGGSTFDNFEVPPEAAPALVVAPTASDAQINACPAGVLSATGGPTAGSAGRAVPHNREAWVEQPELWLFV